MCAVVCVCVFILMLRSDKWVWIFIKKFRQILVFCISNHIASKHHHTTAKKWSKKKIKTPVNASSWYGCYFDFTSHGIPLKRHWVSKKWKRCNRKKETFLKDEIERINSFSLSLSLPLPLFRSVVNHTNVQWNRMPFAKFIRLKRKFRGINTQSFLSFIPKL